MTPEDACSDLLGAVEMFAACTESGKDMAMAWCRARATKLSTPEGEEHVDMLRSRILKTGGSWIPGMASLRPSGELDVHGICSIVEAYDSATPICSPDGEP